MIVNIHVSVDVAKNSSEQFGFDGVEMQCVPRIGDTIWFDHEGGASGYQVRHVGYHPLRANSAVDVSAHSIRDVHCGRRDADRLAKLSREWYARQVTAPPPATPQGRIETPLR